MNTLTARHTLAFAPARSAERRTPSASASASVAAASRSSRAGWIERLADWADRQPAHRRVGSWVSYR